MKTWQSEQIPRHWRGKGDEEDREHNGRTVLRVTWGEFGERNVAEQQLEIGDGEHSERRQLEENN